MVDESIVAGNSAGKTLLETRQGFRLDRNGYPHRRFQYLNSYFLIQTNLKDGKNSLYLEQNL
jgi:hypothetical protein